jgi:carbonic anhydrase/acetyltransferase-like protein (isoleucine patch superfamily)
MNATPTGFGPPIGTVNGQKPAVHATAWVAHTASVTGSVTLGPRRSVWYCASVRGDLETIAIGADSNVQDCSALGMSSTVMNGAVIGSDSIVAAGALVTEGTHIPPGSLVLGSPAKVIRTVTQVERQRIVDNATEYVRLAYEHARATP